MGSFGRDRGALSNDMMVVSMANARRILGIGQDEFSDIVLEVPNELEHDSVVQTIYERFDNVHVISKQQLQRKYQNAYDFSSGLFLIFAMLALLVFCLILYFKYAYAGSAAKKEVGILRALGFSIAAVMKLKFAESFIASSLGFFAGFIAAFGYVYGLDALFIKDIFLGRSNFEYLYDFSPVFDPALFLKLYVLFVSASMAAVLVPTWRVSVSSPKEALK
jgi:ABC-type lipoprotein release transport system permease subunit